jgi:predicted ABC-type ATPase
MPQSGDDAPLLLVIGGPNGSGKSTAYRDTDFEREGRSFWIVNPDLLAARIHQGETLPLDEANLQAVIRIEAWLRACIGVHKSIGVETVLSSAKYREVVDAAKAKGFTIWFIYVLLDSPDRNVERVRLRVDRGGHDVPEAKIRERYVRSLQQMPWFLEAADRAWVYDNSGATPDLIARKEDGILLVLPKATRNFLEAIKDFPVDP